MSRRGKVLRVASELKPHMLHRVRGPSIHLSFNLAAVLPRRSAQRVSSGSHASRAQPPEVDASFTAWTTGIETLFCSHALSHLSVSLCRGAAFARYSSGISRISRYARNSTPLPRLKPACSFECSSRLSRGFHIRLDRPPACALRPVIPINACTLRITAAGEVSRCFFCRWLRQLLRLLTTTPSSPLKVLYNPKAFWHRFTRRNASGLRPLMQYSPAASRSRSLDRVSVPVWLVILSRPARDRAW